MKSTVLVLGAAGRFGGAAVNAFAAAGWPVIAQTRRAAAPSAGVRALQVPLADTAALTATRAATVIFAVNPLYTRWDEEALSLFRQALAVAQGLGATFMMPGNVYNYGEQMPPLLTESTPECPTTSKGRLRVVMETELREATARGLRGVVIRAGDFFGSGRGSWLDLLIAKDIARGKLAYPGPLEPIHAWAYLPDLARAFVAVAARPDGPAFQRLHFAGHAVNGHEFIDALTNAAADLGLKPAAGFKLGAMPWGLIRSGGLVWPMWRELARMSYLWRVPHALDGHALEGVAGPLAATPLVAALRQSLLDLGLGHEVGRQRAVSSQA